MRYTLHLSNLNHTVENATSGTSESDREYAASYRLSFAESILDTPANILSRDLKVSGFAKLKDMLFSDTKSEILGILPLRLKEHALRNDLRDRMEKKTALDEDPGAVIASVLYLDIWDIPHLPYWITLNNDWFPLLLGTIARRKTFYEQIGDGEKYYAALTKNFAAVSRSIPDVKTDRNKSALEALKHRLNIPTLYSVDGPLKTLQVEKAKLIEYFAQKDTGKKLTRNFKKKPTSRPFRLGVFWHDKQDKTENRTNLAHLIGMKGPGIETYSITLYDTGADGEVAAGITEHSDVDIHLSKIKGLGNKVNAIRDLELDILLIGNNITFGYTEYVAMACHRLARSQMVNYCAVTTTGFSQIDIWLSAKRSERNKSAHTDYTEKLVKMDDTVLCFSGLDHHLEQAAEARNSQGRKSKTQTRFISGANFFKLSPELVDMWAEILHQNPKSTLTLYPYNPNWKKNYPTRQAMETRIFEQCESWGVDPNRISFVGPWNDATEIYKVLASCDVYLDSFPHTGGLSTIDGLISGLPVVSLKGQHQRAIQGPNVLQDVGMENCIAETRAEYVEIAKTLAGNPKLRASVSETSLEMLDGAAFLNAYKFAADVSKSMAKILR